MAETNLNILIVDDDVMNRMHIRRLFDGVETEVSLHEVESSGEALDRLLLEKFDCILVDYQLNGQQGLDVLKAIKEHSPKTTATLLIFDEGQEDIAMRSLRLGATGYLLKEQLGSEQLINAILSCVRRTQNDTKLVEKDYHDPLTGLVSRPLFIDRFERSLSQMARSEKAAALAFIELDNLQSINESFGQDVGDQVVVELAERMKSLLRASDTVGRFNENEFVVLLRDINSSNDCEDLLRRVMTRLTRPVSTRDKKDVSITASIGVALINDTVTSPEQLLQQARDTMPRVKNTGRNNIVFFDQQEDARQKRRRSLLKSAVDGLEQNDFELYYQPKIDLQTRVLVGVEALIRWQHSQHGLLTPDKFSEALEHSAVGRLLGEWVIERAISDLSSWLSLDLPLKVSVNIAPRHLLRPNFVSRLSGLLQGQPNVPADCLEIEIREPQIIENSREVIHTLRRCRDLGVNIALDNFGLGTSSMSYLKQLPINTLKIDRSFVQRMLKSRDDRATVAGVIGLNKAFGYQLIAEGVETKHHEKLLLDMGCQLGQGYAIAKPMQAERVPLWMVSHSRYINTAPKTAQRAQM